MLGVVDLDATKRRWVIRARLHAGQHDGLIATQAARLVDRMRIQPSILQIRLGTDDEERLCPMQGMQPPKVEKAAIHHVEAACLEGNLVEDVNLVQVTVGDMDIRPPWRLQNGVGSLRASSKRFWCLAGISSLTRIRISRSRGCGMGCRS